MVRIVRWDRFLNRSLKWTASVFLMMGLLAISGQVVLGATYVWDGTDGNWGDTAHWTAAAPPPTEPPPADSANVLQFTNYTADYISTVADALGNPYATPFELETLLLGGKAGAANGLVEIDGSDIQFSGTNAKITFNNTNTSGKFINYDIQAPLVLSENITLNGAGYGNSRVRIRGGITNDGTDRSLTKGSTSRFVLGGTNTFAGTTGTVTVKNGVLQVGSGNALGTATTAWAPIILKRADTKTADFRIGDGLTVYSDLTSTQDAGTSGNNVLSVMDNKSGTFAGDIAIPDKSLQVRTHGGEIAITGDITGDKDLLKHQTDGNGLLILSGDNSAWNGKLLIYKGTVRVISNDALGKSLTDGGKEVLISRTAGSENATLQLADGMVVDKQLRMRDGSNGTRYLAVYNDPGTASDTVEWSGPIVVEDTNDLLHLQTNNANNTLILSGTISGVGGIKVPNTGGGGTLVISGDNTYTGDSEIVNGTTRVLSSTAFGTGDVRLGRTGNNATGSTIELTDGVNVANALTVRPNNGDTNKQLRAENVAGTVAEWSGPITLNDGLKLNPYTDTTLTLSGSISGAGEATSGLAIKGDGANRKGTVVLSGDNSFTGDVEWLSGHLLLEHDNALGLAPNVLLGKTGSGGYDRRIALELADGVTIDRDLTVRNRGSATSGNNDKRRIDLGEGAELTGDINAAQRVTFLVPDGETATFSGNLNLLDDNLGISTAGSHSAIWLGDSDETTMPDGTTPTGGTLILTGDSSTRIDVSGTTYQGKTEIHSGTLQLDGTLDTYRMVVKPDTTLSGTGTLTVVDSPQNYDLNVQGTLAPGGDAIGTLTLAGGDVRFYDDSFFDVQIGANGVSDQLVVLDGQILLRDSKSILTIDDSAASLGLGYSYTLLDNQTSDLIENEFLGYAEGDVVLTNNGYDLFISYVGGDGNDLILFTLVPEPSTFLLVAIGLITLALLRIRHKR